MSKKRRTLVLIGRDAAGQAAALGKLRDVRSTLEGFNTAADGTPSEGQPTQRLYGPGIVIELSLSNDPTMQAMCHLNDDTIAWGPLERICRATGWRLMDMETGRVMGW